MYQLICDRKAFSTANLGASHTIRVMNPIFLKLLSVSHESKWVLPYHDYSRYQLVPLPSVLSSFLLTEGISVLSSALMYSPLPVDAYNSTHFPVMTILHLLHEGQQKGASDIVLIGTDKEISRHYRLHSKDFPRHLYHLMNNISRRKPSCKGTSSLVCLYLILASNTM